MPGLIVKFMVNPGQDVSKDEEFLKSPFVGILHSIYVILKLLYD